MISTTLLIVGVLQGPTMIDQVAGTNERFQAVSAVSRDTVWISGTGGTFARTVDGGASWQVGVVPGAEALEFRDVDAISGRVAYLLSAGPGDQSRIYRTVDGGDTWSRQFTNQNDDAFFDCLAFWDGKRGLAVSDAVQGSFIVLRTGDGQTWRALPSARLPQARAGEGMFAASGTCVATRGADHAWFGTGAGMTARVARTTDGGETWSVSDTPIVQNTPSAGITSVVFLDERRGMVLGGDVATGDGVTQNAAFTTDGGRTWTAAAHPGFTGAVFGGAWVTGTEATVVAVGPRGASWTGDLGRTWHTFDFRNYWSVGFASDGTGWMVGPAGRITKVTFAP
jgi:photosystem II stability/assembly factor-like uncharacterized protein